MKINKKKFSASLTIEASIVLPIFIFAIISILFFIEIIRLNLQIINTTSYYAEKLSEAAYPINNSYENLPTLIKNGSETLSAEYIEVKINNEIKKDPILSKILDSDISLEDSNILNNNGNINLKANYKINLPIRPFNTPSVNMHNEINCHGFVGYEASQKENENIYVYITQNGTVYHFKESCSYLNPDIRMTSIYKLETERNLEGGKYYPCEICSKYNTLTSIFYITTYGNKYHSSYDCQNLKRTIYKVKLSEVGGKSPCSKCGK